MLQYRCSAFLFIFVAVYLTGSAWASPLHRFLLTHRASRSATTLQTHTNHLYLTAQRVEILTRQLHEDYMGERFDGDRFVRLSELTAPSFHLPSISSVGTPSTMIQDTEIAERHYEHLCKYRKVLSEVHGTETEPFTDRIMEVILEVDPLIERLQEVRVLLNPSPPTIQPPAANGFSQNTERDRRSLFVLQEFKEYITHVVHDYDTLRQRHQVSS